MQRVVNIAATAIVAVFCLTVTGCESESSSTSLVPTVETKDGVPGVPATYSSTPPPTSKTELTPQTEPSPSPTPASIPAMERRHETVAPEPTPASMPTMEPSDVAATPTSELTPSPPLRQPKGPIPLLTRGQIIRVAQPGSLIRLWA